MMAILEIEVARIKRDDATVERIVIFNKVMPAQIPLKEKSTLLSYNIRAPGIKS